MGTLSHAKVKHEAAEEFGHLTVGPAGGATMCGDIIAHGKCSIIERNFFRLNKCISKTDVIATLKM